MIGAVTYCIELQTKDAKSIIEGLSTVQLFISFLAQMIGTLIESQVSFDWTFSSISILMIVSCIPVCFFILKRLISSVLCKF